MSKVIIQFGEGNFLRAFVEWIVQRMNRQTDFAGEVIIVKPRPGDGLKRLQAQGCRYHVNLQGLDGGQPVDSIEPIDCIRQAINPYEDHAAFLALAALPEARFVVSNTTEAGILFDPSCRLADAPPTSFPAKLTQLLYHRFRAFDGAPQKGLIILPCELIFQNGLELERCVHRYIELWVGELGDDYLPFLQWVKRACYFCNTLVDRIVPGAPRKNLETLQARLTRPDALVVQAEPYHLWVIQTARNLPLETLQEAFPAKQAGLNVLITTNESPYHQRKVTLLNGTHSVLAPIGLLAGVGIVRDVCLHPELGPFMHRVMLEELLPTVDLPEAELRAYAESVWERFLNPYVDHQLTSIMLNAVAKYRTRDLPVLKINLQRTGQLPRGLVLGLAAILTQVSEGDRAEAEAFIAEVPGLSEAVAQDIQDIRTRGITKVVKNYS